MRRLLRVVLNLLLVSGLVGLSTPALAQGGGLIVVIDEIRVAQYESDQTIQLYVTVRHPQGDAITDLGPEAFTITVEDQTYVPTQAELQDNAEVSIAIVLELYRTMSGEPFEQAKAAIGNLFTTKPPQDRVAFFGVRPAVDPDSDTIDEAYERDFTNDGGGVNNFVQSSLELVTSGTGTPLYDTLARALRFTAREPMGRRAVIVITDGGDVGSRYTDDTVIDAAEELLVPVFSIGYTRNNRIKDQFLNELARRSGGRYVDTPDSADFDRFLKGVQTAMSQHYLLTYESKPLDSGRRVLEIRVEAGGLFGTHSKHFDLQNGSATPTSPAATATPAPAPAIATATPAPAPAIATATPAPTGIPTATSEPKPDDAQKGAGIIDTLRDDTILIAIIVVGLLLLFITLVSSAILLGRRDRSSEPSWDEELYAPEPVGYDRIPQPGLGGPTSSSPAPGAQAPPAPGVPPPPAPAMPGPGAQPPVVDKTEIIPRGPKMAHYAMLVDRLVPQHKYDLHKPVMTLGRIPSNDITLSDPKISRRHATIKLEGAIFRIYDLGSSNGTFVNDARVREPVPLQDGDIVRLGDTAFVFKVIPLLD